MARLQEERSHLLNGTAARNAARHTFAAHCRVLLVPVAALCAICYVVLQQRPGALVNPADSIGVVGVDNPAVIHFMFMVVDGVFHVDIWKAFFASAPEGSYRIWLHCKYPDKCRKAGVYQLPGLQMVSTVQSQWCDDLVTPATHMLKAALASQASLRVRRTDKFVLLSDSTLPVKPFPVVHDILTQSTISDLCLYAAEYWSHGSGHLNSSWLVMAHEWFVLSHDDARTLVDYWVPPNLSTPLHGRRYFVPFKVPLHGARWSTLNQTTTTESFPDLGGCPDELAVFAILYGVIDSGWSSRAYVRGFGEVDMYADQEQGRCRTLVLWDDEPRERELLYGAKDGSEFRPSTSREPGVIVNLGPEVMSRLRNSLYLFVRKVSANASLHGYTQRVLTI